MSKILKFFNIVPQKNQSWILWSCFLSCMLNAYVGPMFCKTIISELPPQWISFQGCFVCIASILVGMAWKGKFREKAIKWFMWLALAESFAGFGTGMFLYFHGWNVWIYAVFSLLYVSIVSLTIGKCVMAFKTKLWNEKSRELYDNSHSIVSDLALVIGSVAGMIVVPSLNVALVTWASCCILDDIGWIIVYMINRKEINEARIGE